MTTSNRRPANNRPGRNNAGKKRSAAKRPAAGSVPAAGPEAGGAAATGPAAGRRSSVGRSTVGNEVDPSRSVAVATMADGIAVLAFVLIGRSSHGETKSVLEIAWPFLAGLVAGWAAARLLGRPPLHPLTGLVVALNTVVIGLLLRWVAQNDPPPAAFALVAVTFLTLLMQGWRLLARFAAARAAARARA